MHRVTEDGTTGLLLYSRSPVASCVEIPHLRYTFGTREPMCETCAKRSCVKENIPA
jgi:hypothetical protein